MTAPAFYTPPGGIIEDTPEYTFSYAVDSTTHAVTLSTVYKPGSDGFNAAALAAVARNAITDLNTAEALLNSGGAKWDGLTAAQRTAIMIGLVRQNRALIRLVIGNLDSPS